LNRAHPNCGGPDPNSLDPNYPYGAAGNTLIGTWGYDIATAALYNPNTYRDYMSYCGPEWTSDYTYKGIADFWLSTQAAPQTIAKETLTLSGWIDEHGQVHLDPMLQRTASILPDAQGSHRIELLNAQGQVLASQTFSPRLIATDSKTQQAYVNGFRVTLPVVTGISTIRIYDGETLVFERTATAPAPTLQAHSVALLGDGRGAVRWRLAAGAPGTVFHARFSPDGGRTWTVLAINQTVTHMHIPHELMKTAAQPMLEIQATDGAQLSTLLIPLPVSEAIYSDKQ
jgi:hypothetical protein